MFRYHASLSGNASRKSGLRLPNSSLLTCADPENFLGGGGGGGVQIPRKGLTENFNMAKVNNLAIPVGGGGGSGPPPPPPPGLWICP